MIEDISHSSYIQQQFEGRSMIAYHCLIQAGGDYISDSKASIIKEITATDTERKVGFDALT